jgi:hypothetical protein
MMAIIRGVDFASKTAKFTYVCALKRLSAIIYAQSRCPSYRFYGGDALLDDSLCIVYYSVEAMMIR